MTYEDGVKTATKEEYISLREEILRLKGQRFAVAGASITLITALLGWVMSVGEKPPYSYSSAFVLLLLTCACGLTWLMGRDMVRIGTYLQVFYDSQWEQRLEKFEGEANWIGTNTILGILYVLLGLVSCFLLHAVGSVSNDQEVARWVFNISVAIFLVSVLSTIFYSYDRTGFLKKWISVPDKDSNPTVPSKD